MTLDVALNAALTASSYTAFTAVQIELPLYTINVLNSSGYVTFPVNGVETTFTGSDPVYGSLASIGTMSQSMQSESPRCSVTLMPPTSEAVGSLCQPEVQGSRIRIYEGAVNAQTGAVVGTPHQRWLGRLDVTSVSASQGARMVEIETATVLEAFLIASEGERLNSAWQDFHFPGQRGLEFNVAATEDPPWGIEGVTGSRINGTGGGGSGGGGGGRGGGGGEVIINDF